MPAAGSRSCVIEAWQVLGERYELGEVLGTGGMAEVRRARDIRLGREVAIKVLRPEVTDDPDIVEAFRTEAMSSARLNHPGVVAVYDVGEADLDGVRRPYLVMEMIEGVPLSSLLVDGTSLTVERSIEIAVDVCSALAHAHERGVVHRDVTPANLMIMPNGAVKVTDFGIARAVAAGGSPADEVDAGRGYGSVAYISPEQARRRTVDARSDLYSFGCVLMTMLTGKPPFVGSPGDIVVAHVRTPPPVPSQRRPGIDPAIDEVVGRCLAKDPWQRPQTAAELRRDLLRILVELDALAARAAAGGGLASPDHGDVDVTELPTARVASGLLPALPPDVEPGRAQAGALPAGAAAAGAPHLPSQAGLSPPGGSHTPGPPAPPGAGSDRPPVAPSAHAVTPPRPPTESLAVGGPDTASPDGPPGASGVRTPPPAGSTPSPPTPPTSMSALSGSGGVPGLPTDARGTAPPATPGSGTAPTPEFDERRLSRWWLRAGIVAVLVAAVAVVLSGVRAGERSGTTAEVPVTTGLTVTAAELALTDVGLEVGEPIAETSPDIASGLVVRTDPAAGAEVARGSAVTLVISSGPAAVPVPELEGLNVAQAELALRGGQLQVGEIIEQDGPAPAGEVRRSDPSFGTVLPEGSAVALYVGSGRNSVPNVAGLAEGAARDRLNRSGFSSEVEYSDESGAGPGTVLSSAPANGVLLELGSTVTITVSRPVSDTPAASAIPTDPGVLSQRQSAAAGASTPGGSSTSVQTVTETETVTAP